MRSADALAWTVAHDRLYAMKNCAISMHVAPVNVCTDVAGGVSSQVFGHFLFA